jgi:hypothetical protein
MLQQKLRKGTASHELVLSGPKSRLTTMCGRTLLAKIGEAKITMGRLSSRFRMMCCRMLLAKIGSRKSTTGRLDSRFRSRQRRARELGMLDRCNSVVRDGCGFIHDGASLRFRCFIWLNGFRFNFVHPARRRSLRSGDRCRDSRGPVAKLAARRLGPRR